MQLSDGSGAASKDKTDKDTNTETTNDACRYRDPKSKTKQDRGKEECAKKDGCAWDSSIKGGGACMSNSGIGLSFMSMANYVGLDVASLQLPAFLGRCAAT